MILFTVPIVVEGAMANTVYAWLYQDPYHSIHIAASTTFSVSSNSLLLFIIFTTNSSSIGSYRYLLAVFASCDIMASVGHASFQPIMHMTTSGAYCFPYHGKIMIGGRKCIRNWLVIGSFDTAFTFMFFATYYQTLLVLAYHFIYRYKIVTGALAPPEIMDIYGADLRDPNRGFIVIALRRPESSGEMVWHTPTVVVFLAFLVMFGGMTSVILFCIWQINKVIRNPVSNLSEKTRRLQMGLFKALLIQTAIPMIFSFAPLATLMVYPAVTGISLGAFGNVLFSITTIFPGLDALFVLFFIARFRIAVMRLLRLPISDILPISSSAGHYHYRSDARATVVKAMTPNRAIQ